MRTASVDPQIVVSADNSPYLAWQTQLFCFSALTRLHKHPLVIVHRGAAPLLPEFEIVKSWGCRVVEAPQFHNHPKQVYLARNEVGSLLVASSLPELRQGHVLFCEADMLFVKRVRYTGQLSAERYTYMDYKAERVAATARKFGLEDRLEEFNRTQAIGVPYLIPGGDLPRIASRWMAVLDAFDTLEWIDIMYAFGLALALENITPNITNHMILNLDHMAPLDKSIIHYGYGDERWSKRSFWDSSPLTCLPEPSTTGLSGTVLGEMLTQIKQARTSSRFPRILSGFWSRVASISG